MDKELIPISEAAVLLGVSITTLRRWDENGKFPAIRKTIEGNRYYSKRDIEVYLNDLFKIGRDWVFNATELPNQNYCPNSAVFQARLGNMQSALGNSNNKEIQGIFPLVVAVAGEIGNNSFDHNLGNWPDIPGIFFAYDLNKRQVVLADRGQGILHTLKRVRTELKTDETALKVAFTEMVSGRAPENRGNGLKFVKKVVMENLVGLYFQTGNAELDLKRDSSDLHIRNAGNYFRGCMAVITF